MKINSIFILFIPFVLWSYGLPKHLQKKVNKEIINTYNVEDFQFNAISFSKNITASLPAKFGDNNFFEIKVDDTLLGFAYIAKAPSKTDAFDYLVLLDTELIIVKTKVLIYREDYGGEIGSKRWLKQFTGKTKNDALLYGDNIVAISGATISVRSMTNAMNNLLASLKILHNKNIL
ncbi:MAG: FMN-binding protein [Oceanihabitans sp.]